MALTRRRPCAPPLGPALVVAALAAHAASAGAVERVAVLEFTAEPEKAASQVELESITDEARRAAVDVLDARQWLVVTREAQEAVLRDNGIKASDVCAASCEVDVARTIGAAILVTGSVKKIGSQLHLYLKVFHAEKGQALKITKVSAKSVEDIYERTYDATKATLREGMGLDASAPRAPVAAVAPAPRGAPASSTMAPAVASARASTPPAVVEGAPWIGVTVSELSAALGKRRGVKRGVVVSGVADDGPAAQAGLLMGDIVTAVDGRAVKDPDAFIESVVARRPGATVELSLVRMRDTLDVSVTLGARLPDGTTRVVTKAAAPSAAPGVVGARAGGRPFLGATLSDTRGGALVDVVEPGGPAWAGGLRQGDVVTHVNKRGLDDADGLIDAVRAGPVGAPLNLVVRRSARVITSVVVIGDRAGPRTVPTLTDVAATRPVQTSYAEILQEMTVHSAAGTMSSQELVVMTVAEDGIRTRVDSLSSTGTATTMINGVADTFVWIDHDKRQFWSIPDALAEDTVMPARRAALGLVRDEHGRWSVPDDVIEKTGEKGEHDGVQTIEYAFAAQPDPRMQGKTSIDAALHVPTRGGHPVEPWLRVRRAVVGDPRGDRFPKLWAQYGALGSAPVVSTASARTRVGPATARAESEAALAPVATRTVDESVFLPPADYRRVDPPSWAIER